MSAAAPPTKAGQYDIAKPHGRCVVTNEPINAGDKFVAALRETPQGFERLDVSPGAWAQFDRTGLVAFWQTVMPESNKARKLLVDDTVLCELFERLADVSEPGKISFRFVLGLILMRKRLLLYENTRNNGGVEVWTVKLKGRPNPMEMIDPKLTEDQLGEVTQQIGQILNSEL